MRVGAKSEKEIDRAFTKKLASVDLTSIKLSSLGAYGSSGWPDRLVLLPGGRAIFIELKAPGKMPTDLQRHRIDQLADLGYPVLWFDGADEAFAFVLKELRKDVRK